MQRSHNGSEPTPDVSPKRQDELSGAALAEPGAEHPRPWTKLPRRRNLKLSLMTIGKDILDKGDPRYHRAMRLANSYRKVRSAELANMHGHVSAGAGALLATASLAMAASRFLYERFAETGEPGAGDIGILKQAASLADSARQSELAAWELSAREGVIKRKLDASSQGVPWLQTDGGKTKTGRKTNAERQQRAVDTPALTQRTGMTIDELVGTSPARKGAKNVVEGNRRGAVSGTQRIPGDASEPDSTPGSGNGPADGDSETEEGHGGAAGGQQEAAGSTSADRRRAWDEHPNRYTYGPHGDIVGTSGPYNENSQAWVRPDEKGRGS